MRERLDQSSFERLLDTYGPKLERWPPDLEAAGRASLRESAEARAALQAAVRVERLLSAVPDVEPSARLMARIAAIPISRPAPEQQSLPFRSAWALFAAWAAAGALGVWIGTGAPVGQVMESTGLASEPSLEPESPGGDADDWTELTELAFAVDLALEDE